MYSIRQFLILSLFFGFAAEAVRADDAADPIQNRINQLNKSKKMRNDAITKFRTDVETSIKQMTAENPKAAEDIHHRQLKDLEKIQSEMAVQLFFVELRAQTARRLYTSEVRGLNTELNEGVAADADESSADRKKRFDKIEFRREEARRRRDSEIEKAKTLKVLVMARHSAAINKKLEEQEKEDLELDAKILAQAKTIGGQSPLVTSLETQFRQAAEDDKNVKGKIQAGLPLSGRESPGQSDLGEMQGWVTRLPAEHRTTLIAGLKPIKIFLSRAARSEGDAIWEMIWGQLGAMLREHKWEVGFDFNEQDEILFRTTPVQFEFGWLNEGAVVPLPAAVAKQVDDWVFLTIAEAILFPPLENMRQFHRPSGEIMDFEIGLKERDGKDFTEKTDEKIRQPILEALDALKKGDRQKLSRMKNIVATKGTGEFGIANGGSPWFHADFIYSTTDPEGKKKWHRWETYSKPDYDQLWTRWVRHIDRIFYPQRLSQKLTERWNTLHDQRAPESKK